MSSEETLFVFTVVDKNHQNLLQFSLIQEVHLLLNFNGHFHYYWAGVTKFALKQTAFQENLTLHLNSGGSNCGLLKISGIRGNGVLWEMELQTRYS